MAGGQAIFEWYCMHLHVKRKKLLILTVFTWFLMLDKIQDGGHVWWRHRPSAAPPPLKYTSSCREGQRISAEGKIVSKYCNISKSHGGGGVLMEPPPCTTVGVWLRVYVRGLKQTESLKAYLQSSPVLCVFFFSFSSRMVLLHLNTGEKQHCEISFFRRHYLRPVRWP